MKRIGVLATLSIITTTFCFADRGMMPFNPNVQIFEPVQRAMIAWNGTDEILLLSTDVHASESTMVLEVLPLPAEPEVKKGDLETFRRATDLINWKIHRGGVSKGRVLSEGVVVPSGEVTFHKQIGAHDISVTHLLNASGFVAWVVRYLQSIGIEEDIVSPAMNNLIEDYIKDGFEWFVFDVVSLGEDIVTNEPIQYCFKSDHLFYPLKITSTAQGSTSIELLILTPRLLNRFPSLPIDRIHLKHDPVEISQDELRGLNEDMYSLLKGYDRMRLRIWEIVGDLEEFDADLLAR
ncbi:MAG: DUF2330 domain-containing protein [candidate division WOR-3 bacterium]|nr:MAG: DUF2330 domain-containing protein [candidate division WOR-3 bacterium]